MAKLSKIVERNVKVFEDIHGNQYLSRKEAADANLADQIDSNGTPPALAAEIKKLTYGEKVRLKDYLVDWIDDHDYKNGVGV